MKILIVDDEKEIVSLFQDYLEMFGSYNISIATSGPQALEKVKEQKPDLIILDILMPGLTGFQVLGALRRNPQTANIPVIVSSVTDGPDPREGKRLGIVSFLRKPIDFKKLNQLIQEISIQLGLLEKVIGL